MNRIDRFLWIIPLFLAGSFLLPTLGLVQFRENRDEGTYLSYASRLSEQGASAFEPLFREYADNRDRHLYPPPSRLATIGLDAVAVHFLGRSLSSLQAVSVGAFFLLLVVVFSGLRVLCGLRTAFWTTLLLAGSPLHLAMARRALSDSWVACISATSFLVFWILLFRREEKISRWVGLGFLMTIAILSREMMAVLVPIFLAIMILWSRREGWTPHRTAFLSISILPAVAATLSWAVAAGGFANAWSAIYLNIASPSSNAYAVKFGTGDWYRYLLDFTLLSPWVAVLFALWLVRLLLQKDSSHGKWICAVAPLLFLLLCAPFTKNVRYALWLETPLRIGAVLFLQRLVGDRDGSVRSTAMMLAITLLLLCADVSSFIWIFIVGQLYDPMTASLLTLRGFPSILSGGPGG